MTLSYIIIEEVFMFSLNHFIWLGISVCLIISLLFIQKRFQLSFRFVLNMMLTVSIISEVVKILCNMEPAPDGRPGMILDPGDLPFHLCSIQIFLMFILKFFIKSPTSKETLLGFMAPTMIIGAILALFVPTVGVEFTVVQVYQYFIFHVFLIFFSIYIIKERLVTWTWKRYIQNISYLALFALLAMWINSALRDVLPRVNFMYLVRPPIDSLAKLVTSFQAWLVYLLILLVLAFTLIGLFHFIVQSIEKHRNHTSKTEK